MADRKSCIVFKAGGCLELLICVLRYSFEYVMNIKIIEGRQKKCVKNICCKEVNGNCNTKMRLYFRSKEHKKPPISKKICQLEISPLTLTYKIKKTAT
nr:hypothetical protein [Tanacetum cinerariifolium]